MGSTPPLMVKVSSFILHVRELFPFIKIKGIKYKFRRGKILFFIRGKDGGKTIRFVYGDGYPIPIQITSSERKKLGRGQKISKS